MLDQADAPMPVIAPSLATTAMKLCQLLGTFRENAVIDEFACGLHDIVASTVHDGLLLQHMGCRLLEKLDQDPTIINTYDPLVTHQA